MRAAAPRPRPFLKWPGGKRSLLPKILDWLPDGPIDCYVEPFLGGGAVFLELARTGRIRRAILGDRNEELVDVWRTVRDRPGDVIEAVGQWRYDESVYYQVRELDPASLDRVQRAARTLYLNRSGFNGLYRLNSSGRFNVPFGRYTNPLLVDADNLRACAAVLRAGVDLVSGDFQAILGRAPAGACVYCDPPYWPVSATSSFTSYDGCPFGADDQARLGQVFKALPDRGIYGVLSNSWTDGAIGIYGGLDHVEVAARRGINRDATKRGPVSELLVRTRRPE